NICRGELGCVGKHTKVRGVGRNRDVEQELLAPSVFGRVACRLQVIVVWKQKTIVTVRMNGVTNEQVPHQVGGLLGRDVERLRLGDMRDPSYTHHKPREGVTKRLPFLAVEEYERPLRRDPTGE